MIRGLEKYIRHGDIQLLKASLLSDSESIKNMSINNITHNDVLRFTDSKLLQHTIALNTAAESIAKYSNELISFIKQQDKLK